MRELTAPIHSFESFATLDGEGIRYAVFFVGCPLRCVYCHNPDTRFGTGTEYTPRRLADKILRYKPYFGRDGGVTFSGGEPLLHARFIAATQEILAECGVGCAIDTSGNVPIDADVIAATAGADMIILDLKFWDNASYARYVGGSLDETLSYLDICIGLKKRVWIRTVIVPGVNDTEEAVKRYAELLKGRTIEKFELLAFHTMGFYKYEEIGIKNPLADTPPMDTERLAQLQAAADKILEGELK